MIPQHNLVPAESGLLVFDGNTSKIFPDRNPENSMIIPAGEKAKAWSSVERILNRAINFSLGRDGILVGIGGGVVCDVTAFASSIYMRGCRLVLIPTTLLAMVDAAVGGKTGINYAGSKNLVGTFFPAEEVRICLDILDSLPEVEYLSGLAEVIKHAMIEPTGTTLFNLLKSERRRILAREKEILEELISQAVNIKVHYVRDDIQESGKRSYLNLGHTFAHALEATTNYALCSHGEAVIWGIGKALSLGERLQITDKAWAEEVRQLIMDYGFGEIISAISPDEILKAMATDKKKRKGRIRFVLIHKIGELSIQEVPDSELEIVLTQRN